MIFFIVMTSLLRKTFAKLDWEPELAKQRSAVKAITGSLPSKGSTHLKRYGFAVFCVFVAFGIRSLLTRFIANELPLMFFVAAVLVAAAYGGAMPGVIALILGLLLGDFFFVKPAAAPGAAIALLTPQLGRYIFTASAGIILIEILHRSHLRTRAIVEELQREVARRKITEERLTEAQALLDQHAAELERRVMVRTEELQGLLYHMAHNLRAPLRAMEGFAALLLEEHTSGLDNTGRDYTQRICNAAMRMDMLIRDLLELGRLSHMEVKLHRTNLNLVIERVLAGAAYQIKTTGAEVAVNGPLPEVWAVEGLAEQALCNLLENALKFVPPGRKPCIHLFAEEREATVRLWVQDNGIGVEPEYYERIFGVFERLHADAYEGTGIGLAIVKQSMQRMGGQVGIESKVGEGSKFWVEFSRIQGVEV